MATLKDVAKKACVDISTVSRALNNTSYVHPDTKARIYKAAAELGYHPNMVARALRQGKRHTIGVVVPRLHLTIFSEILQGIEQEARSLAYTTLICVTEDDPKIEKDGLNQLRNGFVDGILIAGTGRNGRMLRDIQASGIAVLQLVRWQNPKISSVVADYEACGYEAVHFLYKKGSREIGLIDGAKHLMPYQGRYDGYMKAIAELKLNANLSACNQPVNSFEYGYECTRQLISDNYALDAIIAAIDIQGLGAIRALKEAGIHIPRQMRLISLTGHDVGKMLQTTMTSIEMPAAEIGQKATRMLIEYIEAPIDKKPAAQHLKLSATLVEREST